MPPLRPLELEREIQLGAVGFDLATGVQLQIQLHDLGDAQIAQRLSSAPNRGGSGFLPRLRAGADHLDYLVDATSPVVLPLMYQAGRRCSWRATTQHPQ